MAILDKFVEVYSEDYLRIVESTEKVLKEALSATNSYLQVSLDDGEALEATLKVLLDLH